ncbi:MAG: hypothetical protein J6U21_12945 [Bacteroidales bacterium]|nr:hypothetical protein [Bacteroidales bacterium]
MKYPLSRIIFSALEDVFFHFGGLQIMILHRIFATSEQKTKFEVLLMRTEGRTAENFATALASIFVLD